MVRLLLIMLAVLWAPLFGADSFTATGPGTVVTLTASPLGFLQSGTYQISGSFTATLQWQYSQDRSSWSTFNTYTAPAGPITFTAPGYYRLNCSAYTSGTAIGTVSVGPRIYQQQYGSNGSLLFQVDDAGVTAPGLRSSASSTGLPTGLTAVSPIFAPDTVLTSATNDTAAAPEARAFYPSSVYFLPLAQRLNLQSALDQYGAVRLENGDYSLGTAANSAITMRTGYRLYGVGVISCKVPSLIIAAGAQGVVVSGVGSFANPQTIAFNAGATTANCMFRHVGYVTYTGTSCDVDGCTWIDCVNSQWLIDCTAGGHWSNNRMIGMSSQGTAPELSIKGNPLIPSVGNQYGIHISLQQNAGNNGIILQNHSNASVWLMNSERNNGTALPGLVADNTNDVLRLFSIAGGQNAGTMLSIGAPLFLLNYNNLSGNTITTAFGSTNTVSASFEDIRQSLNTDAATLPTRFSGYDNSGTTTKQNGTAISTALAAGPAASFASLMYPARTEAVWNTPTWDLPPAPGLGPQWAASLASLPDSSAYLQGLINAGIAMPGPGVFKVVTPLKMGDGHGLIGAGMNRTILVAATTGTDIFVNDTGITGDNQHIVLTDCTLQGGANGIHHSSGLVARYQFTNMIISHVCFRDMVNAGMFCDQIYAWDSNAIANCDFVNCGYGLRSFGPAAAPNDYIGYVDKMHIFHCRFLTCGYGTFWNELNRADNNDVCVSCAFNDCSTAASSGDQMNEQAFINCVFNNNVGDPTVKVSAGELQMLGCTMNCGGQSFGSMVDGSSIYLTDCTMNVGTGTGFNGFGTTFPTSQKILHNNTFNIPCPNGMQNVQSINNNFTKDNSNLNVGWAFKTASVLTTPIATTSAPVPQFLRGAALPALIERFETIDGQGVDTPFSPKLLSVAAAATYPEARTIIKLSSHMVEDFANGPLQDKSAGGNINSTGANNDTAHIGVWKLQTLAGATNIAALGTNAVGMTFGQGSGYLDWVFQLPVLSNGTDRYTIRIGFGSQNATDPNDGCYLRYSDAMNAGKWQFVTRSAGVETATDTGVAADILWHRIRITFNAAGTSLAVSFDGAAAVATNTTNIPNGQFRTFGLLAEITKSLGSTSLAMLLDMVDFTMSQNL